MGYSEKNINTMVKNSLALAGGFCFKIADPPKSAAMSAQKNPFDGFGVISASAMKCEAYAARYLGQDRSGYVPAYWESKFLGEFGAFSLKMLEDHQAGYLDWCAKLPRAVVLTPLGIYHDRGDMRIYLFDWNALSPLYAKGFSIHKKFLAKLAFNQVTIKTKTFSTNNVIMAEDLLAAYGEDIYQEGYGAKGKVQV